MSAAKNPFRNPRNATMGGVGSEAFTVGGVDIEPQFVSAAIETNTDATLVLVLEHDGETIIDGAGVSRTFGTAAGVAYAFKANEPKQLRVRKIVSAGSTGSTVGKFIY